MKVSVIILNWNGGAADCIESVASALAQDHRDMEVIFVDNGSTDDSLQAVRRAYPEIRYLSLPENLGCPEGRNRGAEIATGELLMFLENDGAWATTDVVSGVVELFGRFPDLGALYTRVDGYRSGKVDPPLDPRTRTSGEAVISSSFRGGASAIRSVVFRRAGGFPGDFMYGGEERYLSWKIYQLGSTVAYWPGRVMRHKGSDYAGKSEMRMRNMFANDINTILRLYPVLWMFWYLPGKLLLHGLRFMRRRRFAEFWVVLCAVLKRQPWRQEAQRLSIGTLWHVNAIRYAYITHSYT